MARLGHIAWWDWFPFFRRWRIVVTVEAADEIPDLLPAKGAALVGSDNHPKWLAFDCPCNSGHRIMVSLDRAHSPHWKFSDPRKLTIAPSVDYRTAQRRCHYFVRNGKMVWVNDMEGRRYG